MRHLCPRCCTSPPYAPSQQSGKAWAWRRLYTCSIPSVTNCTTTFSRCQGLLAKILLFVNNSSLQPAEFAVRPRARLGAPFRTITRHLSAGFAHWWLTKYCFCTVGHCGGGLGSPPRLGFLRHSLRFARQYKNTAFCIIGYIVRPTTRSPSAPQWVAPRWLALRVVPRWYHGVSQVRAADAAGLPRRTAPPSREGGRSTSVGLVCNRCLLDLGTSPFPKVTSLYHIFNPPSRLIPKSDNICPTMRGRSPRVSGNSALLPVAQSARAYNSVVSMRSC